MRNRKWYRLFIFMALLCMLLLVSTWEVASAQDNNSYDLVIRNGRVMDPDSGLDAIRNVGIRNDRIVEISKDSLTGTESIDATGLIVAPGFIDLHSHGHTNTENEYQAHDGVTTALELEVGKVFIREWLASRSGNALINYGTSASHIGFRWMAMDDFAKDVAETKSLVEKEGIESEKTKNIINFGSDANYMPLDDKETGVLFERLREGLEAGGIGIGVPVEYSPGVSPDELFKVYQFATEQDMIIFSHLRGFRIAAIHEAIANVATTGAALHIVHLNSSSLGDIGPALSLIEAGQKRGLNITTEIYPYTAASTYLQSALFDEGWQQRMQISYEDLQWVATGERLNENTFKRYREEGGFAIIHVMKPEWIEHAISSEFTMIASDGMPYSAMAHPRSAGTFSRVLGRYVREQKILSQMDALRKMTIMPAKRLESIAPGMRYKGRIQVGSDADITIYDPDTVLDTATFEEGLSFSEGIMHVIVNGTPIIRNGETIEGAMPGRAVVGKYRQ